MLSRIAEALFWIGRYVERADDTSRILDTHLQVLLEDSWVDEAVACRSLLSVMGVDDVPADVDRHDVVNRLVDDMTSASSIIGSLGAARENSRRARETVSTEMWQVLNATWTALPAVRSNAMSVHDFLTWVRERAAMVAGVADATMSHDDCWHFIALGRALERADMTARLLAMRAIEGGPSWTHLMRSCGAYQAFLRTYRGSAGDENAAEFLLLDRLFPRTVFAALTTAEACLEALEPTSGRVGVAEGARRRLGRVRTGLEYRGAADLLADLPGEMERIQRACSQASDDVAARFFPRGATTAWVTEGVS
ncbi:MAG: hypothetical protein QOI54_1546 [Actinomycetota bacterium]|nr:hypothetical protein [Actinomycetota bacterium]